MKQNCAALLRLTANLEFAACNLIASIEERSPNLINDYIVYVDKLNDDGLSSIKKVCQYYGKQAVVREYSLNIDLKKMVHSLRDILLSFFRCLKFLIVCANTKT